MVRSALLAALALSACATAPVGANLGIGPDGAAGISARTPMTAEALAQAAPGFAIEQSETVSGERRFARITLSLDDEIIFSVYPAPDRSRATGIGTRSAQARGPEGETIGVTRFGATRGVDRESCRTALAHERFTFSCADASGRFWRAYEVAARYDGARDTFAAIPAEVADGAVLAQMYWVAPN